MKWSWVAFARIFPNVGEVVDRDPDVMAGINPSSGGRLVGVSRALHIETLPLCSEEGWPYMSERSFALTFNSYSGHSF